MSLKGRQRPFAASGSSRWPDLVTESLTRQCVPPPPSVKFGLERVFGSGRFGVV
jgi:hypothetical protein